ncbi:MAG: ShlB/FhaC/HecB family hemolysin secretion/activation protein [Candidatus Muiribacteriaceae bacterium]
MRKGVGVFLCILIFSVIVSGADAANTIKATGAEASSKRIERKLYFDRLREKIQGASKEPIPDIPVSDNFSSLYEISYNKRFKCNELKFNESSYISEKYLNSIRHRFEGKTIDNLTLQFILNQLNTRYYKSGHYFTKAVFPPQELDDGTVNIFFIEPRIGNVTVTDNRSTSSAYIKKKTGIIEGELYQIDDVRYDMLRFNFTHDIRARLSMSPGEEFSTTDVRIKVFEPGRMRTTMAVDDLGREEAGEYRTTLFHIHNSVSGRRDPISLNLVYSEGSLDSMLTYSWHNRFSSTQKGITVRRTDTEIVDGSLESLNIESELDGYTYYIKKNQFVTSRESRNFTWLLENTESATFFNKSKTFDSTLTKLSAKWDRVIYLNTGYFYNTHTLMRGLKSLGGEATFTVYDYNEESLHHIGNGSLRKLIRFQLSDDSFINTSAQFQLGGTGTVRGYDDGLISGDNGVSISLEYNPSNPVLLGKALKGISDSFFIDWGNIFAITDRDLQDSNHKQLMSAGYILRYSGKGHTAGITFAYPIFDHEYQNDDDMKTNFYINREF